MKPARLFPSVAICLLGLVAAGLISGCFSPLATRHAAITQIPANPTIAILPFDNYTDQDLVAAKVTEYFQSIMAARPNYTVIENGTTFEALRRLRIRTATVLRQGQLDTLAQALHADYFLAGSVLEYREVGDKFLDRIPQVSINARLIDAKTGATVWTGVSNDSGDRKELLFGLGAIKSADELSRKMIESMVANIDELFHRAGGQSS
ncbi:hypothetical protein C3F09_02060 [candidate division GN15 bacterium]|uniref:Penicillin-binding protein activator LpoB n=1 Tax=candidate division GN15 bacterium TaxID=2072418 RepID=A0A855XCH4_9BACT|nr:MAG: hypothetical protein C3F09_02060 [candidate division GN15 bacterium]